MGGIISSLATNAACCFGNAALSCFCQACGATVSTSSRVGYALIFITTATLSWIMLTDWATEYLSKISHGFIELKCPQGDCFGVIAVYRICFATTLFHIILALATYNVSSTRNWRAGIQNGYWGIKLIVWMAIIALSFFIPNEFFIAWSSYIDVPGASLFIFIQVILLIDFAHSVSETLLGWSEEYDDRRYLGALAGLTFGSYILTILATGFMYAWFAAGPCQLNQFFISFNWILALIVSVASIAPAVQETNPKSGLAPAAMVSIYSTYLVASAVSSAPISNELSVCNPTLQSENAKTTTIVLGSLFTFLALAYSTVRAASDPAFAGSAEESVPLTSEHLQSAVDAGAVRESVNDDEQDGVQYNYTIFHVIFMLGSMYLAMLITNWNAVYQDGDLTVIGQSMAAVWVKIVSSWIVLILFGWTVVAPLVLPDRDWD